jgi:hypothetical protein
MRHAFNGDQVQNAKGSWGDNGGHHVEEERRSMMNYMQTLPFKKLYLSKHFINGDHRPIEKKI